MPWYRCLARGENFPKANAETGALTRYGFYTTRYVVANSPKEAEMKALALMRLETIFQPPAGCEKPKDAKVFFEEVQQMRWPLLALCRSAKGATWYTMNDEVI